MNRINTLRNLNGAPAATADNSPEALAATLRQLADLINQTSASPLPSGTSIDWPVHKALSAAARLNGEEQALQNDGAFRGPGRILGPMFDGDAVRSPTRRYSFRSRSRFASASSMAARRGSVAAEADTEVEAEEPDDTAEINDEEEDDELEMEIHDDRSAWADDEDEEEEDAAAPGKTGTVMRDETESDGTRKIEIQLRRSRGSVTLVIPKTPGPDSQMKGFEPDTPHPGILFQLSPGFQLPGEMETEPQTTEEHGGAHSYNGHLQPPAEKRIAQALTYLRSNYKRQDPRWHHHTASIEAYLDFLHPSSAPPKRKRQGVLGPGDAQVVEEQAVLAERLARVERLEEIAHAEMDGRPSDPASIVAYKASLAPKPPALDDKTLAMISECRSRLKRDADFYDQPSVERVRIIKDPSQARAQPDPNHSFLKHLLATSGRRFARGLAMTGSVAVTIAPKQEQEVQEVQEHDQEDEEQDDDTGNVETHPFTVHMDRYRRFRQHYMEEARIIAEQENVDNPKWATLPPSDAVFSHGFARAHKNGTLDYRQALPAHMERDRQLLNLLHGLNRQLVRRLDTAHRPLLDDIVKYSEQGLKGEALPHGGLVLRNEYDFTVSDDGNDDNAGVRPLSESEARWLQFLLSDSTNEKLARPLPKGPYMDEDRLLNPNNPADIRAKTEEDGSCSLYYAFAHRFQTLMDADAKDPHGLFPTTDTLVPATAVVDAINKQSAGSTTKFSIYDGLHFLSRLNKAGRCRFRHYPIDDHLGVVQRPLLTLHPEHRLHKSPRSNDEDEELHYEDDSIGAPRRMTELDASWDDTIARGSRNVPASFRRFFCCLAFRFGQTLRNLEITERPKWKAFIDKEAALADSGENDDQVDRMRTSIQIWRDTYEKIVSKMANPKQARSLRDVLRLADPAKYRELVGDRDAPLTEKSAAKYIRSQIIREASQGSNVRPSTRANKTIWDGAQPEIVGEAPPQYFHMDRWPLHLQKKSTAEQIKEGAEIALDPEILWDPASEDLTPPEYLWSVSTEDRRYGFRRIERAETSYHLGDTALQRQVVVQDMTRRVAAAIGIPYETISGRERQKEGWFGWLASKLGKRKRNDEEDEEDDEDVVEYDFVTTELPKAKKILKGVHWAELGLGELEEEKEEENKEKEKEEDADEVMYDDDVEDDDEVEITLDRDLRAEAAAWTSDDDRELLRELTLGRRA